EKPGPAADGVTPAAEQGGIAIEIVHVVEMRSLERRQNFRIVLVAGPAAQNVEAGADASVVIRDHSAEMMGDNLEPWITVKPAAKHHPHHRHGGVIGPAEAPPHLE